MEGRLLYDAAVSRWLDDFLDLWIGRSDDLVENRPAVEQLREWRTD